MNIGEFFVTLGFKADTAKVKDFAKAIGDLPIDVAAGIAALAGLEFQLTKVASEAMNAAVGFQMFSSQTGLSWQELQRWQIVAEQANVSAESVASSVTALERGMAEIRLGRGNIAPFQMLEIGVNQNAFGVLSQLRERIKGRDRPTATNLISQMGINPEMIQVLSLTNDEFARLSKTVSGMTGQQEGSFLRAKQSLVQLGLEFRYFGFELIDHLNTGFEMLQDNLLRFKIVLYGVGIALAGLAIYFFPITAAIVSLLLVLDDLSVYFSGGNSVVGLALEGFKKMAAALDPFVGKLGKIGSAVGVIAAVANPVGTTAGYIANKVASYITQNNQIHVHSTAPAADVGKAVKKEIDKGVSDAALQSNNGGY